MKKILVLFLFNLMLFAQPINNYQCVLVPSKYSFFKNENEFNLNTNTKLLLEKYGFRAMMAKGEITPEIMKSNCECLYADLEVSSGLFTKKLSIVLKDCFNNTVFKTDEGKSNEKDHNKAYNIAFREAAKSFDKVRYFPKNPETIVKLKPEETKNDLEKTNGEKSNIYFAKATTYGFLITDSYSKEILMLYTTSQKDVFLAKNEKHHGIVQTKNGNWVFEYLENGALVSEEMQLKF